MSAEVGVNTLVVDADRQASTFRATQAMLSPSKYACVHEPDPTQLRYLRDVTGVPLILVDTPSSLAEGGVVEQVIPYADEIIVPSDMGPLPLPPTVDTIDFVVRRGSRAKVLLNGIAPGHKSLELDARQFLSGYQVHASDEEGSAMLQTGIPCLQATVRRYVAHAKAISDGIPITDIEAMGAGNARSDLLRVFLELVKMSPPLHAYVSGLR